MVRLITLLLTTLLSLPVFASVTATLDRQRIQENETVTLTLTLDESNLFGSPDIKPLEKDFVIRNSQKSSQSQWVNGQSSATTQWRYVLEPRQPGIITIPALRIGKQQTQALTLEVKQVHNPGGHSSDPVFLEVSADKTTVQVQEQILLTLRINHAVQLSNLEISPLNLDNARIIEGEGAQYEKTINGRTYGVYEKVYAIFPQQSGELTIPAINVNAIIPRSQMDIMMRQGQSRKLRSDALNITVNAATPAQQLPARRLHLQESWSVDPGKLNVGDSITRIITTEADGLLAEQLPDIPAGTADGLRIYNEKPQFENRNSSNGNTGLRTDTIAMVATQPGDITLPAIQVQWWNTDTRQTETAELPAITLHISGEPLISPQTPLVAPEQSHTEQPGTGTATKQPAHGRSSLLGWQLATLFSSLLAVILAILYIRQYRKKPLPANTITNEPDTKAAAQKALKIACSNNDTAQIRHCLLQWAQQVWPDERIHALADIRRILNKPEVSSWLNKLDASLYQQQDASYDWMDFYRLLQAIHEKDTTDNQTLYPTR